MGNPVLLDMTGIYAITNRVNGKVYVGQSTRLGRRISQHKVRWKEYSKKPDTKIYRAIEKHGIENFDFSVIEQCPVEMLNERETYWINFYDSFSNGYNATVGGNSRMAYWTGKKRDKATNEKIASKLRGSKQSEETKKKRVASLLSAYYAKKDKGIFVRARHRAVHCNELNRDFVSVKKCAEAIGVTESALIRALKQGRKCKGFSCSYIP